MVPRPERSTAAESASSETTIVTDADRDARRPAQLSRRDPDDHHSPRPGTVPPANTPSLRERAKSASRSRELRNRALEVPVEGRQLPRARGFPRRLGGVANRRSVASAGESARVPERAVWPVPRVSPIAGYATTARRSDHRPIATRTMLPSTGCASSASSRRSPCWPGRPPRSPAVRRFGGPGGPLACTGWQAAAVFPAAVVEVLVALAAVIPLDLA